MEGINNKNRNMVAEDLIKRSDAIEAYNDNLETSEVGTMLNDKEYFQALQSIPTVEPCKDAVSREWLLTELEEMNVANFYELNEHSNEMYGQMKRMIKAAPSVTVEPKQGEWVDSKGNPDLFSKHGIYCSQCGEYSEYRDYYCGNCGAKMKGEGE